MTVGILQLSVQWNKNKRKILKMHLVAEQLYHFWSSCKSKLMIILFDQKNRPTIAEEIYRNSYFFLRFWRATHNFHLETLWCFTTSMTSGCCIAGGHKERGIGLSPSCEEILKWTRVLHLSHWPRTIESPVQISRRKLDILVSFCWAGFFAVLCHIIF